jgi:PAT family beta-lactamase induction signal transducer AmpG
MALCLLPGVITTMLTPEPRVPAFPVTLKAAVVDPLVEYFSRSNALWILAFILMYKIGDTMAAAMTTPFYLDIGFQKPRSVPWSSCSDSGPPSPAPFIGGIMP